MLELEPGEQGMHRFYVFLSLGLRERERAPAHARASCARESVEREREERESWFSFCSSSSFFFFDRVFLLRSSHSSRKKNKGKRDSPTLSFATPYFLSPSLPLSFLLLSFSSLSRDAAAHASRGRCRWRKRRREAGALFCLCFFFLMGGLELAKARETTANLSLAVLCSLCSRMSLSSIPMHTEHERMQTKL